MNTTERMQKEIDNHLMHLKNLREAMECGVINEGVPRLTENELFLLRLVEAKEKELEKQKEFMELFEMVRELDANRWRTK